MESLRKLTSGPMAGFRHRVYSSVPLWIRRRDFELFTLFLCLAAGFPLLISRRVEATSMEATLPFHIVYIWSLVLAVAPLLIVIGASMSHRRTGLHSFKWIRWEVFGLRVLSYAAYFYAFVIIYYSATRLEAFQPAAVFVLVFGFACTSRGWGLLEDIENFWRSVGVRDCA